jgi:hypothetical protein
MKNLKSIFGTCVLSLALGACGGSDSSSAEDAGQAGNVGKLMKKAQNSLKAAGQSIPQAALRTMAFDDPCSIDFSDADKAAEFIGCTLQSNSGSPDTALGALSFLSQMITEIEKQMSLTWPSAPANSGTLSFDLEFSEGTVPVKIALREQAASAPWNQRLDICVLELDGNPVNANMAACVSNGFGVTMLIKESASELAFKITTRVNDEYELMSYRLDAATDTMRYEVWDLNNSNHMRTFIGGSVSDTLVLDNVDEVVFAWGGEASGIYGTFDGENVCMNTSTDAELELGDCADTFPEYAAGFNTFPSDDALDTFKDFADNLSKGLLAFTADTFNINTFFNDD